LVAFAILGLGGCWTTGNTSGYHSEMTGEQFEARLLSQYPRGTPKHQVRTGLQDRGIVVGSVAQHLIVTVENPWWKPHPVAGPPNLARFTVMFDHRDGLVGARKLGPGEDFK
jgi:hypothetical protein